jgi:ABC-type sugar transport system ATPase subunit
MAENTLVVRRESTGVPALRATGMRKRFGGIEVLHGVDIELRPGEVHALLGENGAGKSTIINMLSGRLSPDAGRLELNGERIEFKNPLSARRAGISMIAQELEVVPTMSIVENIFLGAEPSWYGLIQWGDARRKVISVLKELGVNAEPGRIVGSMSVADQQLVEIAKAIVGDFHVLIMDEPTSALNLQDTERLFKIVRRLKADGVAILYVSHRLWEVFDLADRVTVLRDGNLVASSLVAETDITTVIRAMLGNKSSLIANAERPRKSAADTKEKTPTRSLDSVDSGTLLRNISLSVHDGEIVGLAGVLGSGRAELCEAIYGLRPIDRGTLSLNGAPTDLNEPKASLANGVFLLPEDRKSEGVFGHLDVRENVVLGYNPATDPAAVKIASTTTNRSSWRLAGAAPIPAPAERRAFDAMRAALGIKCSGPSSNISHLSGGNQQKALFARGALSHPNVMVLSEPTRGVDVGAKEEIYSAIDSFAARGVAIIVASSEISELLRLASRIYVLRSGRIAAEVETTSTTEEQVLKLMAG